MTPRERTAVHEAGHAVVARALGRKLDHMALEGVHVDEVRGYASYYEPRWRTSLERISGELSITLAGRIAEAISDGEDWQALPWTAVVGLEVQFGERNSRSDFCDDVAALIRPDVDHDATARLEASYWFDRALPEAAAQAGRILERSWSDVTALAARLERSGRVEFAAA